MNELEWMVRPKALDAIEKQTEALGFTMASEGRTGALLSVLAGAKPGGNLLELGTGTGIATAWLLSGMDAAARLTSVDTDAVVQQVARECLGEDSRLALILEDGLAFLRSQRAESFDLIFADAMPGKYEGLKECLATLRHGGFYVVDDLLPQPNWPEGHAAKVPELLRSLQTNAGLRIAPMAWATGVLVAVRS